MAVLIRKLDGKSHLPPRRTLIYADSGAGKTYLTGTAQDSPDLKDVLVCDIDGGSTTLLGRGDIAAATTRLPQDVEDVLWMIQSRDAAVAGIKTLVLDGGSELQKRDLQEIAAVAVAKNKREDKDASELQDYKINKSRILRIFRMARDLPVNVIITAWAKKTYPKVPGTKQEDKSREPTLIVPDFTDGVMDVLRGYVDDVWYLYHDVDTNARKLITSNLGPIVAKTRLDSFAERLGQTTADGKWLPIVDNPNLTEIYKLYKSAVGQ